MIRLLGNLALLLGTLFLLGGLGEVVLRTLPSHSGVTHRDGIIKHRFNPFRPDGVLGFSLRPDAEAVHETDDFKVTVRTNGLALRGGPASAHKDRGVFRILTLGDSFAFGFGVEDDETFSARLEAQLGDRLGRVEVLNAGVPGWSADHYLVFLRTRGFALDPDLVLLAVTENDLGDLAWNRLRLGADRLPERIESTRRLIDYRGRMRYVKGAPELRIPGREWLADHSYLYHWIWFRITKLWISVSQEGEVKRRRARAGESPEEPLETLPVTEIQRGLLTGRPFQLKYHRFLTEAIAQECAERDIALRTLLIAFRPDGEERSPEVQALHEDCARNPTGCLDSESFFSPEEFEEVFFASDGHWNPRGHEQVAVRIADWLTQEGRVQRLKAADPSPEAE